MKKINFENLRERNDYQIDYFIGGINMYEFIKHGKNYMIKNSNGRIVSPKEKRQLERQELILEDIKSNKCQEKATKKIQEINKELELAEQEAKKTTPKKRKTKKTNKAEIENVLDESDSIITETETTL